MQHAGRAVVRSGTTVAISLLALVVLPVPFLRSIGIAGMLIPLVSVAVAITLLPVVLATIGPRLDRRHTQREDRPSRGWTAWARFVVRHRWSAAILSTAVLTGLVFAASTIQLGSPQAGTFHLPAMDMGRLILRLVVKVDHKGDHICAIGSPDLLAIGN